MAHAVAESKERENEQGADLNHVDRYVDRGRAPNAALGNVGDGKREGYRRQHHECRAGVRGIHEVRPKGPDQIPAEDAHDTDHHAGIDPIIKMGGPSVDALGEPGVAPDFLVIEERLFGKVIRTAGTGIKVSHFRIKESRSEAKQERHHNADPHGWPSNAGGRLNKERLFSGRSRHTRYIGDWSSDVCSSDLCSAPARSWPAWSAAAKARIADTEFGSRSRAFRMTVTASPLRPVAVRISPSVTCASGRSGSSVLARSAACCARPAVVTSFVRL